MAGKIPAQSFCSNVSFSLLAGAGFDSKGGCYMMHISVLRCMRLLLLVLADVVADGAGKITALLVPPLRVRRPRYRQQSHPLLRFLFAFEKTAAGPSVLPGRRCARQKIFQERSVELKIAPRHAGTGRLPSRFDLPLTLQHLHMHPSRKISKLKAISIKRSSHCLSYFCLVTT